MHNKTQSSDNLAPSLGERLLILRNREQLSQRAMAKRHHCTLTYYSKIERELEPGRDVFPAPPPVGRLAQHERCLLMRRRSRRTQLDVATALGRCRYWIVRVEAGLEDCTELANYWEQ